MKSPASRARRSVRPFAVVVPEFSTLEGARSSDATGLRPALSNMEHGVFHERLLKEQPVEPSKAGWPANPA
jgi:hypothetical protein